MTARTLCLFQVIMTWLRVRKDDLLFWFQIVMAWVHTGAQVMQILHGKTSGMTLAMWFIFMGYLLVSLSLAILAWKTRKEKIRLYTVIIYAQWTIFITILFFMCVGSVHWSSGDTVVCIAVAVLSVITVKINGLKDPMTRGWLAVWCKGLPQLWAAYVMYQAGSAEWLHPVTLLAGHATSIPRLIQVYLQGKQTGWDRATKGLLIGETANVFTWCVVTVVWLALRVFGTQGH